MFVEKYHWATRFNTKMKAFRNTMRDGSDIDFSYSD